MTFIGTLLSFAFSLLFAIVGLALFGALNHVNPHMTVAYRHIALPAAAVGAPVIFVLSFVTEIRHYLRSKTLSAIARIS